MNALNLLIADHNRVRGLVARFHTAEERDDSDALAELAATLFDELKVHTTIEEEIFYPAVQQMSEELADQVVEAVEEHHVVDTLMEEAQSLDSGAEEWTAKVKVLIENVEHHAEEEESEMFPAVRSACDAVTLDGIGEQLEERKRQLGAPTAADVVDLTKEELLQKAQEQEIPGRSSMSREELAATVDPR